MKKPTPWTSYIDTWYFALAELVERDRIAVDRM
jgi:hypothetical protein